MTENIFNKTLYVAEFNIFQTRYFAKRLSEYEPYQRDATHLLRH